VAWGHIPRETIERIEIVRGPTSALYGSEGLGGVIHVITKKPQAERQTSIRGEAGSADTYGSHGFHSQKFGDFGILLGGGNPAPQRAGGGGSRQPSTRCRL
jgi:outer membrane cobalamin receptor